jgi:hypothetical protein
MSSNTIYTAEDRTPYTYLIGWTVHNKWYYGRRTAKNCDPSDLWSKYFTSSKHVKEFTKLHGEPDVVLVRKTFSTIEACVAWEVKVLKRLNAAKSQRWLNLTNGDMKFHTSGCKLSEEHIKKIVASNTGKKHSVEHRNNIGMAHLGKKRSISAKDNMAKAATGRKHVTQTIKKISEAKADKTEYTFQNKNTGEIFIGIKNDFIKRFNLNHGNLYSLIQGKRSSVSGWFLI